MAKLHLVGSELRIAYLSASALPSRAANSVHVMKMCSAFGRLGHDVDLYCFNGQPVLENEELFDRYGISGGFRIFRMQRTLPWALGAIEYSLRVRRALAEVSDGGYDVIYARHRYSLSVAPASRAARVFEAHVPPRSPFEMIVERRILKSRRFQRLIVISDALKGEYLRLFPCIPPEVVKVAHDGADPPGEVILNRRHSSSLAGCEIPTVGYVGHLYTGKGMEIVSQLPPLVPEAKFIVVGGTEDDLATWRNRASFRNLTFLGYRPHREAMDEAARMDILLAPYQTRVFVHGKDGDIARWMSPLKLFEYMSLRKPIIASDLPVLREVLEHEKNALLVPPDDPAAWAVAVRRLLADKNLRDTLARNAARDFIEKYTWYERARQVILGLD